MKEIIEQLPQYYQDYIGALEGVSDPMSGNTNEALSATFENTMELFSNIYPEQKDYSYAPGKWTIAEVFGHLIDADRISAYRALRISRGDEENQPGWDQNDFAATANYHNRSFDSIKQELLCTMESTGYLFEGMNEEQLDRIGISNNYAATPRILGLIAAGHRQHHLNILQERYLSETFKL